MSDPFDLLLMRALIGGSEQRSWATLLWTNESPTSDFESQDVTVNLSDYSFILVVYRQSTTEGGTTSHVVEIGGGADIAFSITTSKLVFRQAYAISEKVHFGGGAIISTYGNYTAGDNYCIPIKIYGIR